MRLLTYLLPLVLQAQYASSFAPPQRAIVHQKGVVPLFGIPFVGRFRKKKPVVDVPERISVGSTIPEGDVEILTTNEEGEIVTVPVAIAEVLGTGLSVLVGMPGAFTPTCSSEHLPGYIAAAPKLRELGIDKIAVLTTNDKFVNEKWARSMGLINESDELDGSVALLSDGDGDFVKALGLAEDMGFGVGVRSTRFALITENCTVTQIMADEGMNSCSSTSAANLVEFLTPVPVPEVEDARDLNMDSFKMIGAGLALAATFVAFSSFGGDSSTPKPVPPIVQSSRPAVVAPAPTKTAPTSSSASQVNSFSLLKQYL